MVGASKILTVSYGTFSCTLEGFEQPFNTMKAIAEYFRDLAADDRYFGAEPPQPDAEMLHKIAEREIQRRVEAKIQKNGIVLRPSEAEAQLEAPQPPVAEAPASTPSVRVPFAQPVPEAPQPQLTQVSIPVPRPDPVAEEAMPHDPVTESVAAKLQRIRAAVAQARASQAVEETAEFEAEPEAIAEPTGFVAPQEAPEADSAEGDFGFALDISGPLSDEETAEIGEVETPEAEAEVHSEPEVAPEPESAKAPETEPEPEPAEAPEAEIAPEAAPEAPAEAHDDAATITEVEAAEEAAIAAAEEMRQVRQRRRAERRAARLAQIEAEKAQAAKAESEADAQEESAADAPQEPEAAELEEAPLVSTEAVEAPAEDVTEDAPVETVSEEPDALIAEAAQELEAEASEPETVEAPVVEPARPMVRARVIKLRRAQPVEEAASDIAQAVQDAQPEAPEALAETAAVAEDDADAMLAAIAAQLDEAPEETAQDAVEPVEAADEADEALLAELAALTEDLPDDEDWGTLTSLQTNLDAIEADEIEEDSAPIETVDETVAETPVQEQPAFEPAELEAAEVEPAAQAEEAEEAALESDYEDDLEEDFIEEFDEDESDLDDAPEAAAPTPVTPAPEQPTSEAPQAPTNKRALPEGDLSRLLEKADEQMAVTENRRRISAIAHLKAAVAATVADRKAGADSQQGSDETEPYRQDLSHAVRPRRPVAAAKTERPEGITAQSARPEVRPAPLVLVSEQRVDRSTPEESVTAQAVRPRRITAASLHREIEPESAESSAEHEAISAEAATSFAEFAESRSPQGLGELLEAAAAYTEQVEGRPHFSPPQIMRKVTAIGEETFSREDRLRVFGTLLRQGKIAKVKRGQYAITEASRFYQRRA
ncbi:hypothetical protein SAMN05877809_103289 [Rhodobacter sp. JA431]|nr:hypothetical protein SAMN05877809_103289 [Rhodobacter sp. JA431]